MLLLLFLLVVKDGTPSRIHAFLILPTSHGAIFGSRVSTTHLFYNQGSNITDEVFSEAVTADYTALSTLQQQQQHQRMGHSNNHHHNNITNKSNIGLVRVAPNGAQITMVGSGPGSPDLLTVAAYRLLTCDTNSHNQRKLIIADRLVSSDVLDICVGEVRVAKKYPGCAEQV